MSYTRVNGPEATELAELILKSKKEELDARNEKLGADIKALYVKTVPEQVLKCQESHPEYFSNGFVYVYVGEAHLGRWSLSSVTKAWHTNTKLCLTSDEGADILKRYEDIKRDGKKYGEVLAKLKATIKALGSAKKIIEHFPETQSYWEVSDETCVSLEAIKSKIKEI